MAYIGRTTDGFGVRQRFVFTPDAGTTSISGNDVSGATLTFSDSVYMDVFLNGVLLKAGTDYNTNTANTIAGLTATVANDEVTVLVYDIFTTADMVSATSGGTFSGNVTHSGTVTVDDTTDSTSTTTGSIQTDGGLGVAKDVVVGDDVLLKSDSAAIQFGSDSEITLTHSADSGLLLKHAASGDDKFPTFTFQTGDTDIASDDVLGRILFQAPDEGTGTDAITASARIQAFSTGDFSSSSNSTGLELRVANSAVVGTAGDGTSLTLLPDNQLNFKSIATVDGSFPQFELQTGETTVETNDILGSISFKAPDESSGTDAILQAAFIIARASADFTSSVNSTSLQFGTGASGSASTRMTIESDGDVSIDSGNLVFSTSGKGIDFSAVSTSASGSNSALLDDYEEGTFSVSATIASGALAISGSYNLLSYTKVGQRVFISGGIRLASANASGSPSGAVNLDDLPFTPASASEDEIHSCFFVAHDSMTGMSAQPMIGQILPGNTNIFIFTQDASGFADCGNHFTDNSILRFNFSYIAA
jgi:hypothetical protein